MAAKSVYTAYLLWLIGGFFGLHLFYLQRDRHVFMYWCTMGGYLGFGPFIDFFKIPNYVRDINEDEGYMKKLIDRMKASETPPFSFARFFVQMMVGNFWGFLFAAAIPTEEIYGISLQFLTYLAPFASALAVWIIGNIGREKGRLKWALLGSSIVLPFSLKSTANLKWASHISTIVFNWSSREWRRNPRQKRSVKKRIFILLSCWMLFCSFWCSYLYFNAEVTDKHNVKIKLRDAVKNFWNSPIVQEFRKHIYVVYDEFKTNGYNQAWQKLIEVFDPLGENHALKILGLPKGTSQKDISLTYKKLVKEWHPDKHQSKSTEELEEINQRFVEIQNAYEKLSSIKKTRSQKNKLSQNA